MPTVLRFGAFRAVIYPNDHRPAHVHVIGRGSEAVYKLGCPAGSIIVRENYGFSKSVIALIKRFLRKNLAHLCSEWRRIHGEA